jgi:SAM-dependent methyltransferase
MNYKVAYTIGFHPWEDAAEHPPFTEKIRELLEREERGLDRPYGKALDLGTGSGIWGIELARRGWEVTGVDVVDKALERARERVRDAGVDVRLAHGDVTNLRGDGIGSGFRLLLDTGTFHGLGDAERTAMGREVSAIAAPEATLLLIAWPRRRRPLIRGVSREEIEEAFPGWSVTDAGPSNFQAPKPIQLLLRPDERWYRLRRN